MSTTSNFHPLPLAMINDRFYEPSEHTAFYASVVVAANLRGQTSGGSTAEYLIGPSVGFARYFLFTGGAYIGSLASLTPNYQLNSQVPFKNNAVPLITNYTGPLRLRNHLHQAMSQPASPHPRKR